VNIRTAALGLAIAGLAVAGCDTAATVGSHPKATRSHPQGCRCAVDWRTGTADRTDYSHPFRLSTPGRKPFRQA